jgi:N-acetylated-alpha-linked acidic dipeptidase
MTHAGRSLGAAALLAGSILSGLAISRGAQDTPEIFGFASSRVAVERQLEQQFRAIPDPERAESDLRYLTSEPHLAGTEASHRIAEWLRDQYRGFGFEAEIVTYNVWLGYPREAKLEITQPVQKTLGSQEQPLGSDKESDGKKLVPAFNAYSPSCDVTAPVVYVNYGMQEDYRELARLGMGVEGKIALARYGRGYRGIKAKLAEEHKAAALIIYSDPQDDGYAQGDTYPDGPWRPMTAVQRGSILYTQIYPGDPLTPGAAATPNAKRIAPADAANLPHIPTMPINAQDASAILQNLGGKHVPRGWQGALPFTYHIGGDELVHLKLDMDYAQRPIYDVIAKLRGVEDDQWVILGNHHDAWVYGAADPGSGTAAMLETARALGELVKSGWKPRRTILLAEWGGEEPGLLGSTEWVEANRAELQAKAVAYINTDVGVTGEDFSASAAPSLKELLRDVTRDVDDPGTGLSVYRVWSERAASPRDQSGAPRPLPTVGILGEPPIGELGAGSDFCPFFDYAGIPSMDVGFQGDYGVYHSAYDDFYWMQHFGDPKFTYHVALANVLGTLALRLAEADILPYDFQAYASEIGRSTSDLIARAGHDPNDLASLTPVSDAATQLDDSAMHAAGALRSISGVTLDPARADEINRALASVEQELLAPQGLIGRPWFKHTIYAPGSYAGYVAEEMPGVSEALDRDDEITLRRESESLAAALRRASARLDAVARLAQSAASGAPEGR